MLTSPMPFAADGISKKENDRIGRINRIDEGPAGKGLQLFSRNIPFIQ